MADQDPPLIIRPARTDDEPFLVSLLPRLADFPLPAWRTADEIAKADRQILHDALTGVHFDAEDPEVPGPTTWQPGVFVFCLGSRSPHLISQVHPQRISQHIGFHR